MERALILKGPGTNCDGETAFACRKAGFEAKVVASREFFADPVMIESAGLFIVPGGFSFGDDLGAGTVLGNQLRQVRDRLWTHVRTGGLMLGICNGFQVFVRAGLLPDPMYGEQTLSLTFNESGRFEDRWTRLAIVSTRCVFFREPALIELPVAHAEGRLVAANPGVFDHIRPQVILRYVSAEGGEAGYPANPSGSVGGIASICDPTGRVLGLMPHPERFVDPHQHPRWTRAMPETADGVQVFRNAFEYLRSR